jgi:hypothetical protein
MKSFHIKVSEGTGDPVRRSVSGHPPRRGIFRGEICGMSSSGGAPQACPHTTTNEQIRPTTRPQFLLSNPLSSSHPPLPSTHPVRLSSLFFVFVSLFEKCSCLFVPGPDPGLGPGVSDATKLESHFYGEPTLEALSRPPAELDPETSATYVCSLSQPCRNSPSAPSAKFWKITV